MILKKRYTRRLNLYRQIKIPSNILPSTNRDNQQNFCTFCFFWVNRNWCGNIYQFYPNFLTPEMKIQKLILKNKFSNKLTHIFRNMPIRLMQVHAFS